MANKKWQTEEWINKMSPNYLVDNYFTLKRKEIGYVTTQMYLEGTMLSAIN
jgi:hypothetical protein